MLIPKNVIDKMVRHQPHLQALAGRAEIWEGAARRLAANYLRAGDENAKLTDKEMLALRMVANGALAWPLPTSSESSEPRAKTPLKAVS